MQDTVSFLSQNHHSSLSGLFHHHPHDFPSLSRPRNILFPVLSFNPNTVILHPPPPPKNPEIPSVSPPPPPAVADPRSHFKEKMLYLDSLGIDFLNLMDDHPPIVSTRLSDIRSTVDYMTTFVGFTSLELRRIVWMCPELLTYELNSHTIPVLTFLLREACVDGTGGLRRALHRRPRLLACSVKRQLRPTMYFLQSIGVGEIHKHTSLLSCSVEHKLNPRIEYFEKMGFSRRDAVSMFRRFPQLFNCSVNENYKPKLNYFVVEMRRDLKEIKEFPQYFSFSLENRIRPRHQRCVERGVKFSLPVLLKTSESQFRDRLEVCCSSSTPLKSSPLYCTKNYDVH